MRPPIVPRSLRPFTALDNAILLMIKHSIGGPCPTIREIREWTAMPRRRIWDYLSGMVDRGLIEVELKETKEVGKDPKLRRMRAVGGEWTGWTARGGCPAIDAKCEAGGA